MSVPLVVPAFKTDKVAVFADVKRTKDGVEFVFAQTFTLPDSACAGMQILNTLEEYEVYAAEMIEKYG